MKKRMILITITLFVVVIGVSVYIAHRPPSLLSVEEHIHAPQPHEHVATDGNPIRHTHTYDFTEPDTNTDKVKQAEQEFESKHPIQRAWELLDLDAIKKKYQPYTVAEMNEMWYNDRIRYGSSEEEATAEEYYPLDKWLEDLMALGHPFMEEMYYDMALGRHLGMTLNARESWNSGIPKYDSDTGDLVPWGGFSKENYLAEFELPSDTTWDEFVEIQNKFSVVRLMNVLRAEEIDPDVDGGVTSLDGSFLPFSPNLVNVHIDPKTGRTKFIGPSLTAAEEDALVNFGVAPEGMSVVYIDANDKPIPVGKVPPRFYERNMKELAKAQSLLQQQIEEHELLLELDSLLDSSELQKQIGAVPPVRVDEQGQAHTHDLREDSESVPLRQRPSPAVKRVPPGLEFPSEFRTPDAVQRWWTQLEALHGGELPKDLQALWEVMTELEKMKQEGEAKLKPPPRPERPTPPERSSPPPPNEDD